MNLILFHLDSAAHVRASVTRTGRSPSTTFAPTFGSDRALNAISCAGPCSNSRWESTLYTPSWGSGSGLTLLTRLHTCCASRRATRNSSPGVTPSASATWLSIQEYATKSSGTFPARQSLNSSPGARTCKEANACRNLKGHCSSARRVVRHASEFYLLLGHCEDPSAFHTQLQENNLRRIGSMPWKVRQGNEATGAR